MGAEFWHHVASYEPGLGAALLSCQIESHRRSGIDLAGYLDSRIKDMEQAVRWCLKDDRYGGHGEDLQHAGLEPQERDYLPGRQVDRADAAGPLVLGQPLDNGDAAEDGGSSAHLRQPDEGEIPSEVEPAGEARHLGDGHVLGACADR